MKKKIGKSFLELIRVSRIIPALGYVCIICILFFNKTLLEAVIEKCLLNRCLFKLKCSSSFTEINSFTNVLRTLQKLLPCVLGNVKINVQLRSVLLVMPVVNVNRRDWLARKYLCCVN